MGTCISLILSKKKTDVEYSQEHEDVQVIRQRRNEYVSALMDTKE